MNTNDANCSIADNYASAETIVPSPGPEPGVTGQAADMQQAAGKFYAIAGPALVYALLTTIFLYRNFSGITLPLYVLTLMGFVYVTCRRLGQPLKKTVFFYFGGMLLLAAGMTRTANQELIFWGNLMIFILNAALLLHLFCRTLSWSAGKYLSAGLGLVLRSVLTIGTLFADAFAAIRTGKDARTRNLLYLLIGIGILFPLGGIIISLLAAADAVFGQMVNSLLESVFVPDQVIGITFFFLGAFCAGYCSLRFADKGVLSQASPDRRKLPVLIADTVLLPLGLLYLFFSGIQIFSLFLGKMQLPEGYTYAVYAREGFFELMFVCLINVFLVLLAQALFPPHPLTKGLLALISLCTYIMLASSALRLFLYIRVYHLTMLRLEVIWALAILAICMALVTITVFREQFPLTHSAFAVVTLGLALLIWIRPDAVIARYNLAHADGNTDYTYLSSLSADAAPAISAASEACNEKESWVFYYVSQLQQDCTDRNLLQYNFSRAKALRLFADQISDFEATIPFYLCNESGISVSDLTWEFYVDDDILEGGGSSWADGSPICYEGDGSISSEPIAEISRADSFEYADSIEDHICQISCTFTWNGQTWTCSSGSLDCVWGEPITLYLEWDAAGNEFYLFP